MLDDMAARRAYTAAAMDALRAENALRQSDGSAAYGGGDDEDDGGFAAGVDASALMHPVVERASGDQYGDGEEEVIGYIDEDGNIVSTEENAIGVVSLRGGDEVQR
jgi:hypothetical protein